MSEKLTYIVRIYDLRPERFPPPKDVADWLPTGHAKSWKDYAGMGFSCGGILQMDMMSGEMDEVKVTEHIREFSEAFGEGWDPSIPHYGFNNCEFADPLMRGLKHPIPDGLDVMRMIVTQCEDYGATYWKEGRSYSLNNLSLANNAPSVASPQEYTDYWTSGHRELAHDDLRSSIIAIGRILHLFMNDRLINPNTKERITIDF